MTREMNKPEYHTTWYFRVIDSIDECSCTIEIPKQRVLDEYWKPFIDATNERFRKCGE